MWGSSSGHERAVDSRSRRRGNIYPEILGSNHLQSLKMNHWNIGILWNIHMNGNHLLLDISLQPVFFMVFPWFTQPFPMDSGTSWHPSSQRAGFGTRWPGRYSGPRVRRIAATRTAMRPSHGAVGMSYVVGEAADVSVNCFLLVLISRDLFFCFFCFCLFHLEMKWRNLGTMKDSSYPVPSGCYDDFSSYTWDIHGYTVNRIIIYVTCQIVYWVLLTWWYIISP
jgi:hypothetical protein